MRGIPQLIGTLKSHCEDWAPEEGAPEIISRNIRQYSAHIQDLPLQVVWCEESYICHLLNAAPEARELYTATQVPRSRRHPEVAQLLNDLHSDTFEYNRKYCIHGQCGNQEDPLPLGSVCLCQCIAQVEGMTPKLGRALYQARTLQPGPPRTAHGTNPAPIQLERNLNS
ncbi:hypothetical protein CYMTET_26311 [Cymbomonas tetramitiformis]|uniref:Uncharacterized protein n=1 Tax=Cymbomonas tetramitiformis TaxID=36881 RepID=A0AAE0FRY2_9CHLO|nr:hypothetical protein CYMTET_26311 [Cymbomonas tetramitiformis]